VPKVAITAPRDGYFTVSANPNSYQPREMTPQAAIVELMQFKTRPYACGYLPAETARLHYRIIPRISAAAYEDLLSRGWRRFGIEFFRPACHVCAECRSLRIPVEEFTPSRSQQRALKSNAQIEVVVQPPTVTSRHVELYNSYHADMRQRRGWPLREITEKEYAKTFVIGSNDFAREFLYLADGTVVGVALADVLPTALSSVYFIHDPQWRLQSPGVFSVLKQLHFCQQHGLRYQYLGYWVAGCQSMAYKSRYRPHELLVGYPADDELPTWIPAQV
jgi:arginine-tRNA-protein transferase